MLVDDVEAFPGHIACDGASKSEIVVPILSNEEVRNSSVTLVLQKAHLVIQVVAIIDIDCAEINGFDEVDQEGLERLAELIGESCDW